MNETTPPDALARTVHTAWRDGMLFQGREVAENRMIWDTLEERDKELGTYIALEVASVLAVERDALRMRVEGLKKAVNAWWLLHNPDTMKPQSIGWSNAKKEEAIIATRTALAGAEEKK